MNEVEQIRRAHYIEGKSIRGIARDRHHDRRTVRKALRDAGPPRYTLRESRPRPVLDGFTAIIDRWLAEDQEQPPKQRHTAHRIYQRLVQEHGFSGGESTVREYVRKHRPKPQPRFIPLAYDPGEDAQYDFGEGLAIVGGQATTVQLLVARLCYSKQPFVMAFPHQRQEAFFEGHKESFHFFGGVPRNIWYDRLTQAVKRSLMGRRVQEQEGFTAFRSHYLFQSRFCNAGEAHEKGLVENLVGYARRNFLVPVPEVESFQELNALLRERCLAEARRKLRGERQTIGALWEEERPRLLPLPQRDFPCCRTLSVKTNGLSLVTFDTNRYSIPVDTAPEQLWLHAFVDQVQVATRAGVVAVHPRSYGREEDVLEPLHYLPLLRERPGALDHAKPLKQWSWPPWLREYLEALRGRLPYRTATLQFLEVLELLREYPPERLSAALERTLRSGSLGPETVAYFLRTGERGPPAAVVSPLAEAPSGPVVQDRDLKQYDLLLQGR